ALPICCVYLLVELIAQALEEGVREVVQGGEVAIQRRSRHVGQAADLGDRQGVGAPLVDQGQGGAGDLVDGGFYPARAFGGCVHGGELLCYVASSCAPYCRCQARTGHLPGIFYDILSGLATLSLLRPAQVLTKVA